MSIHRSIRTICLLILMSMLLGTTGCITASVVAAGTAIGAASSAVVTGADVYRLGKLDTALMASEDDCINAVREAAANLRLEIHNEKTNKNEHTWKLELTDEQKETTEITVERRTGVLCRVRVDVGWFGNEPTAQLVMAKIREHLPATAAPTGKGGK
jgi:Protein of unknown function (DUF3568)